MGVKQHNPLWENNLIQFARLICEINANVEISKEEWEEMCASMDLSSTDVNRLFDRANDVWEETKAKV